MHCPGVKHGLLKKDAIYMYVTRAACMSGVSVENE